MRNKCTSEEKYTERNILHAFIVTSSGSRMAQMKAIDQNKNLLHAYMRYQEDAKLNLCDLPSCWTFAFKLNIKWTALTSFQP